MVDLPRYLFQRTSSRAIIVHLAILLHRRMLRSRFHSRHEAIEPATKGANWSCPGCCLEPGCVHLVYRHAGQIQQPQPGQDRLGRRSLRNLFPALLLRPNDRSLISIVHVLAIIFFRDRCAGYVGTKAFCLIIF
jgi:hypothetical protein